MAPATPSSKVLLAEEGPADDFAIPAVKSPMGIQHDQVNADQTQISGIAGKTGTQAI